VILKPTFRYNVKYTGGVRVKYQIVEKGTDKSYWNVGHKQPTYAAQHPRGMKTSNAAWRKPELYFGITCADPASVSDYAACCLCGVPIPVEARDSSLFQNVQTEPGDHPTSNSRGTEVGSLGLSGQGVKLASHLNPVPMLRMWAAIGPTSVPHRCLHGVHRKHVTVIFTPHVQWYLG